MVPYIKNFDNWNNHKKKIENISHSNPLYFKEREIWWTSIGVNIGSESDGKNELFERPVLIIKKTGSNMFFGAPITSKKKTGPYFVHIEYNNRSGTVSVVDFRSFSSKRLLRKMTTLEDTFFINVRGQFEKLLNN